MTYREKLNEIRKIDADKLTNKIRHILNEKSNINFDKEVTKEQENFLYLIELINRN